MKYETFEKALKIRKRIESLTSAKSNLSNNIKFVFGDDDDFCKYVLEMNKNFIDEKIELLNVEFKNLVD